jgi:hypothetical protein
VAVGGGGRLNKPSPPPQPGDGPRKECVEQRQQEEMP